MNKWDPLEEPIIFSARRGSEDLFVQVIGGMEHPSGNPQMMAVVLEVRLGPDPPSHVTAHDTGEPT